MPTEIKLWQVHDGKLQRLDDTTFGSEHVEKELEDWIEQTPDILGDDLLIIARQRDLPGVGTLDLLGIDSTGKLVVIELKRNKTPREAVAQALHYASWLDTATEDQIRAIAEEYLKKPLEEAFEEHFSEQLPALVCQNHRIILAAPRLDAAAEAIVNYLAERHGVEINAVFFTYAKVGNTEVLARAFLVAEELAQAGGGRRRRPTVSELLAMASEKKVAPLLQIARQMNQVWEERPSSVYGGSFRYLAPVSQGKGRMVCGINLAGYWKASNGQLDVWIPARSLAEVVGKEEAAIRKVLTEKHDVQKSQYDCIVRLKTPAEAEALVAQLKSWMVNAEKRAAATS